MSDSVLVTRTGAVAEIKLHRPTVHNAFDDKLIADLTAALVDCELDANVRAVLLIGAGTTKTTNTKHNKKRGMSKAGEAENQQDALRLAALMRTLNFLAKPTIAKVNGAAYGGGVGLIACCDVAIGAESAKFALSEVKLGLVPAVISPYVVAAIGLRHARRYFVSGEVFDDAPAARIGLLHESVAADQLDAAVDRAVHFLGKGGPLAQGEAKQLALRVAGVTRESAERSDNVNARLIAHLRVSDEGQRGLAAFLDKRAPEWVKE